MTGSLEPKARFAHYDIAAVPPSPASLSPAAADLENTSRPGFPRQGAFLSAAMARWLWGGDASGMTDRPLSECLKPIVDLASPDAHELHRSKLLPARRAEFGDISHHPPHLNSRAFDGGWATQSFKRSAWRRKVVASGEGTATSPARALRESCANS
jgi:hypothetical protein